MVLKPIQPNQKGIYNKIVDHIMQSWEWGEFRKSFGVPVLRYGLFDKDKLKIAFQLTLHQIPLTNYFVGYLPKGPFPNSELTQALRKIGQEHNCAFIKAEPDVEIDNGQLKIDNSFHKSPKPLFTKYNFIVDLTKSEEMLLKSMHSKTRYNIKVAQKNGVRVEERVDDKAFEIFLNLHFATTKRQKFYSHNEDYHRKLWQVLKEKKMARLLIAYYNQLPLTAWMLFNCKDTLYYPYGGSSDQFKNVMSSNLVAWEAIKLGKRLKLQYFDMWGALGKDPDPKDPWFGFHRFKDGYGGRHVEYIGTYDLILNWPVYLLFTAADKLTPLKVFLLKALGR